MDFQQTDTAMTCSKTQFCEPSSTLATTALTKKATVGGTAGTVEVAVQHVNATNSVNMWFELDVAAGTTWGAGDWTVPINVTTANMSAIVSAVYICQLSSVCGSVASIGTLTGLSDTMTAGVHTYTVTGSAITPSVGDKVMILFRTPTASMVQQFGVTPDQIIVSPFTVPAGPATSFPHQPFTRRNQMKGLLTR